jgi:hypothetical protein
MPKPIIDSDTVWACGCVSAIMMILFGSSILSGILAIIKASHGN